MHGEWQPEQLQNQRSPGTGAARRVAGAAKTGQYRVTLAQSLVPGADLPAFLRYSEPLEAAR